MISSTERATREITQGENLVAAPPAVHFAWFVAGAALGFFIPFIFTSLLSLQHDLYYLIYFAITLSFLALYVRSTRVDAWGFFRRNWRWSLALGALVAAAVVYNVVSWGPTTGPTGPYLVFEAFWRGAVYGVVDALLLTAFPGMVALGLLRGNLAGVLRKAAFVSASLVMVLVITGSYHLGYQQFREAGVGHARFQARLLPGEIVFTTEGRRRVLAHASMHVAATVYSYETEVFLPPQTAAP